MPRVDFYLLAGRDASARRVFACRLAEKAWRAGHKVFIRTGNPREAAIVDDLLWTFRQGSFVPHALAENHAEDPLAKVLIGTDPAPGDFHDLLVHLAPDIPEDWRHFQRIAEIVDEDEAIRHEGRAKYRFYQQQGIGPITHRIG